MRFHSTRGVRNVGLRDALLGGLAPDGGLLVPSHVSAASRSWRQVTRFADLGVKILRPFLEDAMPPEAIERRVGEALNFRVPLIRLDGWEEMYVLELFHGPTLSFKDFGARTMARLMGHFARDEIVTVLVATSGDTGSAVADGFAGQPELRVALLFPEGQVSPTQEAQLTCKRPGVRAFAVEGTFDACQRMVKGALAAPEGLQLTSANSINVGRLLPQMVYYFWAAVRCGAYDPIVSVPCGNLGNLTAGILAKRAGLPVPAFLAAHNANRAFPHYLATGESTFGSSVRTLSNAMDVGAPSNFERLQYLLPDMQNWITGYSVTDRETLQSMRRVFEETGYVADPHTAVGLEAARRHRAAAGLQRPVVILGTAHPAKFPLTIERALGRNPDVPAALANLAAKPRRVQPLQASRSALMSALHAW